MPAGMVLRGPGRGGSAKQPGGDLILDLSKGSQDRSAFNGIEGIGDVTSDEDIGRSATDQGAGLMCAEVASIRTERSKLMRARVDSQGALPLEHRQFTQELAEDRGHREGANAPASPLDNGRSREALTASRAVVPRSWVQQLY